MPDPAATEVYAAAFRSRCASAADAGTQLLSGPGIEGLIAVDGASGTQLLVLDDRAREVLSSVLPSIAGGTVRVHGSAARCAELVRRDPAWTPTKVTAMVCSDLQTMPELSLPEGLTLRPVRRLLDDPPDHVPLADAVEAARRSGSDGEVETEALMGHLRSLRDGPRIFAAVDDEGVVCGTSASQAASSDAYVFFVNTVPKWRRRGVGLSMTATALRVAQRLGASRACLDASGAGVHLYQRLGFTTVGAMTQFTRSN